MVAKIASNSQQNRVGSKRAGLLVPDYEFDGDSHSIPLDDVPIGDEASRIEDGEPEVQRKPVFYGEKDLECKIFPCDYPYGKGCYHVSLYKENKAHTISPSHYLNPDCEVLTHDGGETVLQLPVRSRGEETNP